jgi:hypothetical protein
MGSTVGRFILNHELKPGTWEHPAPESNKKSRRGEYPGVFTAPAYSSTSPPALPGCPLSSRPTTST